MFPQVFTNGMQRIFVPNFSAVKRTFPNGKRGMLGVQHRRRHHPFAAPREPVEYIRFMLPIREEKMNMIRHNDGLVNRCVGVEFRDVPDGFCGVPAIARERQPVQRALATRKGHAASVRRQSRQRLRSERRYRRNRCIPFQRYPLRIAGIAPGAACRSPAFAL